jgi:outer membrane receptor protein involved in Fe transport
MLVNMDVTPMGMPRPVKSSVKTEPNGSGSVSFTEWLPKVALKYTLDQDRYVYASFARGYKAGGNNIQMFADVVRNIVEVKGKSGSPNEPVEQESPEVILESVMYRPEHNWIYELGFKANLMENMLYAELAVFHINARDIQITDFVESGQGRIVKNAGKARSVGFDLALTARLNESLYANANYGFTNAIFKDYKVGEINFRGKVIPYAPQNTLSIGLVYNKRYVNKLIDRFNIQAQYNAAGKIYWTEANDVYQDFYGILNTKATVNKGIFELGIWTNNTLNTDYSVFYFKSLGRNLAQKGRPFTMGVDLSVRF